MELCSGGDLQKMIDQNEHGLEHSEFLNFFRDFMNALQYLKQMNIVHRDIKPLNVVVATFNGLPVYKLGDFGAARVLEPEQRYTSLYGTLEYQHPSIYASSCWRALNIPEPHNTFTSDHELWSVAATLYEAATGKLPFDSTTNPRNNPNILYNMTTNMKEESIAAIEQDNGHIEWLNEMPETSKLSTPLKRRMEKLLAGLFQVSWTRFYTRFKIGT